MPTIFQLMKAMLIYFKPKQLLQIVAVYDAVYKTMLYSALYYAFFCFLFAEAELKHASLALLFAMNFVRPLHLTIK